MIELKWVQNEGEGMFATMRLYYRVMLEVDRNGFVREKSPDDCKWIKVPIEKPGETAVDLDTPTPSPE